jgi:hypothetical protein
MSPLARNWFFGSQYMDYSTPPTSLYFRNLFVPPLPAEQFWIGMAFALGMTYLMTYAGLHVGRVLQRITR